MERESILRACKSEIEKRVNYELGNVIDNVLNERCDPTAKRSIIVKLELSPYLNRAQIRMKASVKAQLAQTTNVATELQIVKDDNGEVCIVEIGKKLPGQTAIIEEAFNDGVTVYISREENCDEHVIQ